MTYSGVKRSCCPLQPPHGKLEGLVDRRGLTDNSRKLTILVNHITYRNQRISTYPMHQRQHDSLRKRTGPVQGHDDLRVRARQQLAELSHILRAQNSEVRVVPLFRLPRGGRGRARQCLLLRKGRRSSRVGGLWCRDVRTKPRRAMHGGLLGLGRRRLLEGGMRWVTGGLVQRSHVRLARE